MKKIILFSFLFCAIFLNAQAPNEFSFQAIVRDAAGNLVANQTVGVRLSILKGSNTGSSVFVETHAVSTNANGLLTLSIGTGSSISGSIVGINWSIDSYFLKSEIDVTGGSNYTISGTSKLASVPYALHANTAGKTYKIGDFAFGGIVFWVDDSGKRGLVCAKFDASSSMRWHSGTIGSVYARGDGLFAGNLNTSIIIAANAAVGNDGNLYAARLANEYQATENGITYGDWYLPSKHELNLLYINRVAINAAATANGGEALSNNSYWSSTEATNNNAHVQNLISGVVGTAIKSGLNHVRFIRRF